MTKLIEGEDKSEYYHPHALRWSMLAFLILSAIVVVLWLQS